VALPVDLPIDHFRLLGVTHSVDAEGVLRTLDRRLDNPPVGGFSAETLEMRAVLLRESADHLSDPDRRRDYEAELMALESEDPAPGVAGLEIPSALDLGGLLLLYEAGQNLDAFEAACRCLQPPQAPALGSAREGDLSLVAALSCRGAAAEERDQRHYDLAARHLRGGLQLLQRMGQLPEQRRAMEQDLEELLPYRILDLVSRDLRCEEERREGLGLLEDLVMRRGGLEGTEPAGGMAPGEFQAFFKQIRRYLTVQEQLDLFLRWEELGSPTAAFLGSYALVASGFAQRKPERLSTAHQRLRAAAQPGLEPVLASLELLLGDVDTAEASFGLCSSDAIQEWARRQESDPLAVLCDFCADWLSREVLPGYRDIPPTPDLDAWFADHDVQAYIEEQDRRQGHPGPGKGAGGWFDEEALAAIVPIPEDPADPVASDLPRVSGPISDPARPGPQDDLPPPRRLPDWRRLSARTLPALKLPALKLSAVKLPAFKLPALKFPAVRLPASVAPLRRPVVAAPILLVLLAAAGLAWWLVGRSGSPEPDVAGSPPSAPASESGTEPAPEPAPQQAPAASLPLTSDEPDLEEIRELLDGWLAAKAAILGGATGEKAQAQRERMAQVARDRLMRRVLAERRADAGRGEHQRIEARVESLQLVSRAGRRIEVDALVRYTDERRDDSDRVLESTDATRLPVTYILGRDGSRWLVHEYISGG
jgi:hypothetical protein